MTTFTIRLSLLGLIVVISAEGGAWERFPWTRALLYRWSPNVFTDDTVIEVLFALQFINDVIYIIYIIYTSFIFNEARDILLYVIEEIII